MSDSVELTRELIRNQCVNTGRVDSGHEHRSVQTLQEYFGVEGEIFEPASGRQTLIYRVPGTEPDAASLALAPHLDVVPADPDGWSVDPFGAEIIDGFIYGRGAVDMLNVTASMAVAVKPYITGEAAPRRDLVFIALADEEGGGKYGAHALVNQRWELVQADFMLTEVAYPPISYANDRYVPVATGEKGTYWTILKSVGTPGHGSTPFNSDNALVKMVEAVHGIATEDMPVAITPEWREMVDTMDLEDGLADDLVDPDKVDEAIERLAIVDPLFAKYVHAVTHLTISPNTMGGGTKANVIADRADASVDIRALPGMDRSYVDSHLQKAMGSARDHIDLEPVMDMEATASPIGNELWDAIADGVEAVEGHRNLLPTIMTVGTDARFWRAKGTIGYGVGLYDDRMSFSEMLALFHGHDERVSAESVEKTTRLYQEIFARFLGQ